MTSTGWKNNVTAGGPDKDDKVTTKELYFTSVALTTALCVIGGIIGYILILFGHKFDGLLASIWIFLALYSVIGIVIIDDEYYDKD